MKNNDYGNTLSFCKYLCTCIHGATNLFFIKSYQVNTTWNCMVHFSWAPCDINNFIINNYIYLFYHQSDYQQLYYCILVLILWVKSWGQIPDLKKNSFWLILVGALLLILVVVFSCFFFFFFLSQGENKVTRKRSKWPNWPGQNFKITLYNLKIQFLHEQIKSLSMKTSKFWTCTKFWIYPKLKISLLHIIRLKLIKRSLPKLQ